MVQQGLNTVKSPKISPILRGLQGSTRFIGSAQNVLRLSLRRTLVRQENRGKILEADVTSLLLEGDRIGCRALLVVAFCIYQASIAVWLLAVRCIPIGDDTHHFGA